MSRQTTLNVSLTRPLQEYVRAKVKSGLYESASEVVRDGLRALREREGGAMDAYWSDVRKRVAVGKRDLAEGRTVDGETAMSQLIAEARAPLPAQTTRRKSTTASRKRARRR